MTTYFVKTCFSITGYIILNYQAVANKDMLTRRNGNWQKNPMSTSSGAPETAFSLLRTEDVFVSESVRFLSQKNKKYSLLFGVP